jgi:hypothetical protein
VRAKDQTYQALELYEIMNVESVFGGYLLFRLNSKFMCVCWMTGWDLIRFDRVDCVRERDRACCVHFQMLSA